MSNKLNIIILAAGKGSRMKSNKLKVLHPLAGTTIIDHVISTCKKLEADKIIMVYGHKGNQLKAHLRDEKLTWVEQSNPRGTGHAVKLAINEVDADAKVLVLVGDAPLVNSSDLQSLMTHEQAVLTASMKNPYGYGRIFKDDDNVVQAIIEQKDASEKQKSINEINSGIILAMQNDLANWLDQINDDNAQNELYLTDVLAIAYAQGKGFSGIKVTDNTSIKGINNPIQLSECEQIIQNKRRHHLMINGVRLSDPNSIHIRGPVITGKDVFIDCGVILEGHNKIADDVMIGPYCLIKNCDLGPGTRIAAHSILEDATTQGDCDIGPFARIRVGTQLAEKSKVGNFVETKKAIIGKNSKASHLTYLGDCEIGNNVNIGAGTITCNYDGVNKHHTRIEDGAFIGSDTQLIAPVTVGKNATIGAGTTLTKNATAEELTLSRAQQRTIKDWKRPK